LEFIQVHGTNDDETINEILKDFFFAEINEYDDIEYEVEYYDANASAAYMDDNLLSVYSVKEAYYKNAAHPYASEEGLTINLNNKVSISVSDIMSLEEIRSRLENGMFTQVGGIEGIFDEDPEMANAGSWFEAYHFYDEQEHKHDFYVDGENLFLIISVPHAAGDFIVISTPFQQ